MKVLKLVVLFTFFLILFACKLDETASIEQSLENYFQALLVDDFVLASEYVHYSTDKPHSINMEEGKSAWLKRMKDAKNQETYVDGYSILTVEHNKESRRFAQSKVTASFMERGKVSTRNIYVHLEKVDGVWKVYNFFTETHDNLDPMAPLLRGYISQAELRN